MNETIDKQQKTGFYMRLLSNNRKCKECETIERQKKGQYETIKTI